MTNSYYSVERYHDGDLLYGQASFCEEGWRWLCTLSNEKGEILRITSIASDQRPLSVLEALIFEVINNKYLEETSLSAIN